MTSPELLKSTGAALERGMPLTSRPFADVARELGAPEAEVIEAAKFLVASGAFRHIGAFVDFRPLGFTGYLFGARASGGLLGDVVARICGMACVTHIYERRASPGLWFTAILPGGGEAAALSEELSARGCPHVALAASRRIKLRAAFAQEGSPIPGADAAAAGTDALRPFPLTPALRKILHAVQTGLPLSPRPFAQIAASCGVSEEAVLDGLRRLASAGVLRRIGALMHHVRSGYVSNSLIAWDLRDLPERDAEEAAMEICRHPWLSHCYLRRVFVNTLGCDWRYNLFTMIHARSGEELRAREDALSRALSGVSFVSMRTKREIKKTPYRIAAERQPGEAVR